MGLKHGGAYTSGYGHLRGFEETVPAAREKLEHLLSGVSAGPGAKRP